jgi:hypothetical protein
MRKISMCLLLLGLTLPLHAAFRDRDWSPRAAGQGGAFAAQDDDAAAVFYNPAGVAFLPQREAGFMYSQPFLGLDQVKLDREYAVACVPLRAGTIGISWTRFGANDLYREDAFGLTYAHDVSPLVASWLGPDQSLSLGASLKYLVHGYGLDERTANDPVFANGSTKGGLTGDLGALYRCPLSDVSNLNVGLGFKNVVPPDLGLASADIVPLETRLGAGFFTTALPKVYSVSAVADAVERTGDVSLYLGSECWIIPEFGVRAGGNPAEYAFGLSGDLSVAGLGIRIDYTFLWPLAVEETSGSHAMSLTTRF